MLKFFLNSNNTAYLRSLEPEFGESTNAIRQELNRFEEAGLLVSEKKGRKKIFKANTLHPLFPELNSLLLKHIGLDKIIERVILNLGKLKEVYLVGELAKGNNSKVVDLWFVGDDLDEEYLEKLAQKAEGIIQRKLNYSTLNKKSLQERLQQYKSDELLLLWQA